MKYEDNGVEKIHRTHINPMLPKLKAESPLNYVTESGVFFGEPLKQFAKSVESDGWTPEAIQQRVQAGIEEYHNITSKLMADAGVDRVLERMNQRKYSVFEQIMNDMGSNIASARGK